MNDIATWYLPFSELQITSSYDEKLKEKVYALFGNNDFSNNLVEIIKECIDDYAVLGYSTWTVSEIGMDGPVVDPFYAFLSRMIIRKYKYFEFYKNRWSIEGGTIYGDKETKTRTLSRERDVNIENSRNISNTHESTTDMDYKTDYTNTDTNSNSSFDMSENAPLGSGETITTPFGKDKSTSTSNGSTTMDRSDTQDITVNSSDTGTDNFTSVSTDDYTDTETETVSYENGVEILKAIKYNNLSIVEVINDIIERTVLEFNQVI